MTKLHSLFSLAAGFGLCASANAQIIFADTFANTDKWAAYGNTSPTFSSTADVLSLAGGGGSHRYIRSLSFSEPATLSSVGDVLTFEFRIRQVGTGNNAAKEFNIGIGNNMGTMGTTGAAASDDIGYVALIAAGARVSGIARDAGVDWYLGRGGPDHTALGADVASGFGLTPAIGFVNYTMTFERTLTGMDISLFNGTTLVERSDNTVPSNDFYTFNMIAVGYYQRAGTDSLDFDSMSVTFSAIPEPTTYAALIGLLALGLVAWRRRR